MELCRQGSFATSGEVSVAQALDVLIAVTDAMDAAHRPGIVHGDLDHAAPEVLDGQEPTTATDVYCPGTLLAQTAILGDPAGLIFTGTPAGVGAGRTPPRYLVPGTLVSTIEGIGDLTMTLTSGA